MNYLIPSVSISEYRYVLPESRVPDRPLDNREDSKLLIYKQGAISERVFSHLPDFIPDKALLVFNNSKVIPARLHFVTSTAAMIEVLCLNPVGKRVENGKECFQDWKCIVGNLKRWKSGAVQLMQIGESVLSAELKERGGEDNVVRFTWESRLTFFDLLEQVGELPLPPYMHREADESDKNRYQTVYASISGSVAAPTAGLHFTSEVLEKIKEKGIDMSEVTLHVGAGTFKPIKSEEVGTHTMHQEFFEVTKELVMSLLAHDFVLPVGTTSMRTLESLYFLGLHLKKDKECTHVLQWSGFEKTECTKEEALKEILNVMEERQIGSLCASTSIMIVPGYQFRICKGLITNFHQPESTLILLVAALVGKDWERIYEYALNNDFRFLSYGDSSLLLP